MSERLQGGLIAICGSTGGFEIALKLCVALDAFQR